VAALLERCLAHLQQPEHHPLPPAAAALGRPFSPRRRRWLVAAGVAAVATVAIVLPFSRPVRTTEMATGSSASALNAGRLEADIGAHGQRVSAGVVRLRQSLLADPPQSDPLGPALEELRERTDALLATFGSDNPVIIDRFTAVAESARQRLAALGREVGQVSQ
jgi:hypothetical protein